MPEIKMQEVQSSAMQAIGYDKESQTLRIKYSETSTYEYACFPEEEWKALQSADSKGRMLGHIRRAYTGVKV